MPLHHLKVEKTARYATYGTLSEHTQTLWFVCHGYAQLVEYFIKKFEILDPQKHFVIAPEGLSRFYADTSSGKVGATWMTKEDRLAEIEDYLGYLNKLYSSIFENTTTRPESLHINVMGFSQGVATASRWIYDQKIKFDRFIAWGGGLAHDIDYSKTAQVFGEKEMVFIYGTEDKLIKAEHFEKQKKQLESLPLKNRRILTFEGGHRVPSEILARHFA